MIALYPGSFDPPHFGHLDVIRRAAAMVQRLVVGVAFNPDKKPFLPVERRVALLRSLCDDYDNVTIASYTDATVHAARRLGCDGLVRGLRSGADLDHERPMAIINKANGFDTLFLLASPEHVHISSSTVRMAVRAQVDWHAMVPVAVHADLERMAAQGRGF